MASPFESFVQVELPKRPFLASDVEAESIIIRRGQGARQLAGIKLGEGQVLSMVGGQLQPVDLSQGAVLDAVVHQQSEAATTWTITHNRNNVNVLVNVYDNTGNRFIPDSLQVAANSVTLGVNVAVAGHAVLVFVPVEEPEPE